jgi:hypothetical protein
MNISTRRFLMCIPDEDLEEIPDKAVIEMNRRKYKRAKIEEERRIKERTGKNPRTN